jgi:transposase-like protein
MPNRHIPTETKVQAMEECLQLVNVEETANRYGVHPNAIYYWFNNKIKANLSVILTNETPGPEPQPQPARGDSKAKSEERPTECDQCGGTRIWKNGTYPVIH